MFVERGLKARASIRNREAENETRNREAKNETSIESLPSAVIDGLSTSL